MSKLSAQKKSKRKIKDKLGIIKPQPPLEIVIDQSEDAVIEFNDVNTYKHELEQKAVKHVKEMFEEGGKNANVFAKMILEPHFPKTKLNINTNLKDMKAVQLLEHMKKVMNE